MNNSNTVIYYVIMFIVSIIITWVVLSLILMWARPALFNANGSVNWWTTLWVAALLIVFVWLIFLILGFIFQAFNGRCRKDECAPKKVDPCDPCAKNGPGAVPGSNFYMGNMWGF